MKFFEIADPFGDNPLEMRRALLHEAATKARASFDAEYPKMATWYETYDPLYLLSFCAFYFLTSPEGVDKEAIEGKLDFAPYHLELLQAFALMGPRNGTAKPLAERTKELRRYLQDLGDSLSLAQMDFPPDLPDSEVRKRMVISEMRRQTFAVRNWAYPEQTLAHVKSMFSGTDILAGEYPGARAGSDQFRQSGVAKSNWNSRAGFRSASQVTSTSPVTTVPTCRPRYAD